MTHGPEHCCPELDVKLWEEKTHAWRDKPFIKGSTPALFHTPFPPLIGRLVGRMWRSAQAADAAPDMKDFLLLAYDPTPFKSEFYMTVTQEVPGAENVKFSGTFISKVFDGPYSAVPKWIKEMDEDMKGRGQKAGKYYFYFTYCRKCAKAYGHNHCVAFIKAA